MTEAWKNEAMAEARELFAHSGVTAAAMGFAALHPRAIQYLRAAPILLAAPLSSMEFRQAFEDGARLRDIMALAGLPMPLRAISPKAIGFLPQCRYRLFGGMGHSRLSQAIPDDPQRQGLWLAHLMTWSNQRVGAPSALDPLFFWAAERIGAELAVGVDPALPIQRVARFAYDGDGFNLAWTWRSARARADHWATRPAPDFASTPSALRGFAVQVRIDDEVVGRIVALGGSLGDATRSLFPAAAGRRFRRDDVLDQAAHPDRTSVEGFLFIALRTGADFLGEGREMDHCLGDFIEAGRGRPAGPGVANHADRAHRGEAHLFSVQRSDGERATLELDRDYTIRHLYGPKNRPVADAVIDAALAFSRQLGGRASASFRAELIAVRDEPRHRFRAVQAHFAEVFTNARAVGFDAAAETGDRPALWRGDLLRTLPPESILPLPRRRP